MTFHSVCLKVSAIFGFYTCGKNLKHFDLSLKDMSCRFMKIYCCNFVARDCLPLLNTLIPPPLTHKLCHFMTKLLSFFCDTCLVFLWHKTAVWDNDVSQLVTYLSSLSGTFHFAAQKHWQSYSLFFIEQNVLLILARYKSNN